MNVQNQLIRWILQPLAKMSNRISTKIRDTAFIMSGLMIFFAHFVYQSQRFSFRFLYLYVFDCLMAGLMLFFSLPKNIAPVKFDKVLLFPWLGFSIMALIAGVTKSVDYLPDVMLYLVMYPIFFLVWNNCDFSSIQKKLLWIAQISFGVFLGINLLFFPISGHQYAGFFCNVNGVSIYLVLIFVCSFQNILSCEQGRIKLIYNYIFLGISAALVVYSNSRTGQLTLITTFFLTVGLLFFVDRHNYGKLFMHRILPAVLSIIIFFPATLYVFQAPQKITQIISEVGKSEQPSEPAPEQPSEPAPEQPSEPAPEQPSEPAPEQPEPPPSTSNKLEDIVEFNQVKTDITNKSLDQISTNRLSIWKDYCKHLTFWGHSNVTDHFIIEVRGTPNSTAHMTILEFAYQFGILAGLFYLAFNILAGLKSIRYSLRNPQNLYALMPFIVSIAFGVMSLLDSFSTSFYNMIVFYYYLMQTPLVEDT